MRRLRTTKLFLLPIWLWQFMPVVIILFLSTSVGYGLEISNRSVQITNSSPSADTSYLLSFFLPSNETLGSVELLFCANSPIATDSCTPPQGMNATSAVLTSQSGTSGFSVGNGTNANTLILSRTPSLALSGQLSFNLSDIINPSSSGPFYGRIMTYATSDASGSNTDFGGLAMSITPTVSVTTYVPPYITLCVGVTIPSYDCSQASGDYLNFGDLSPAVTASADSQLLLATNAAGGYDVQLNGNSMTSGNNVIAPLANPANSAPGNNQFGLNLVANNDPPVGENASGPGSGAPLGSYGLSNLFKFNNGDLLAASNSPSSFKEYTASYIINIAANQPPGYYATTLTYIGIGNF